VDTRLLEYYNRELRYLRELGGEFARDFPKIAGRLGLDAFECADPYVERLLEGFAFLAARVQLKVDAEVPSFSEQLLNLVCPHYLGPTPSMAVVEVTPDQRQGTLNEGFVLPRGTALRAGVPRSDAWCEYRTAHEVTLWPIEIASLTIGPATGSAEVTFASRRPVKSLLRIRLRTTNGAAFQRIPLDALTLFFRGNDSATWRLFELVVGGAVGVATRPPGGAWTRLDDARVTASGTEDSEALLPTGARAFQGYRLLHEFFAFPARFLFARLQGIAPGVRASSGGEIEILVALDRHDPFLDSVATASLVSLFCTPVVNLFPKQADRIELSDADHEHHVVADRAHPTDYEVHTIEAVTGHGAKGEAAVTFVPFYRHRHADDTRAAPRAYYTVQRRDRLTSGPQKGRAGRSSYVGSEVFLALVDGRYGAFRPTLRQLGVDTLCTNRDLPLLLPVGRGETDFVMESSAPVKSVRIVAGPSPPRPSHARGETTWRLVSHLSLNYLTLSDTSPEEGAAALRELLSLYADVSDPVTSRQISGVRTIASRPIVRRLPLDGPPSFGRGIELTVGFDESSFEGTSAFVLGWVLARFFARYVSINSFVETVARTEQRGEIARWPLTMGRRQVL